MKKNTFLLIIGSLICLIYIITVNLRRFQNLIKEETTHEEEASLEEEFAAYLNETKSESADENEPFYSKSKQEEGSFVDVSNDIIQNED